MLAEIALWILKLMSLETNYEAGISKPQSRTAQKLFTQNDGELAIDVIIFREPYCVKASPDWMKNTFGKAAIW